MVIQLKRFLLLFCQDLARYKYEDIVVKSMSLLCRFHSAHKNVFSKAVQAQVCWRHHFMCGQLWRHACCRFSSLTRRVECFMSYRSLFRHSGSWHWRRSMRRSRNRHSACSTASQSKFLPLFTSDVICTGSTCLPACSLLFIQTLLVWWGKSSDQLHEPSDPLQLQYRPFYFLHEHKLCILQVTWGFYF